jgi:hypothetical protein
VSRFLNVNFRFSWPASLRSRRASARAFSMSLPKPGSSTSSASFAANSEPGRSTPPTSLTMAIFESACEPCHRSMARERARRTRTSLKGGFSPLKTTVSWHVQGLSWTVTLSPRARTRSSRCCGE